MHFVDVLSHTFIIKVYFKGKGLSRNDKIEELGLFKNGFL